MDTIQNYISYYEITTINGETILFAGYYESFKQCLEHAVALKQDMSYADLRHQNLAHANLDGAILDYADFSYAQCVGLNLSEASIKYVHFLCTDLRDACLCESDLSHSRFINSNMRLADIGYTTLNKTIFADPSAIKLDFSTSNTIKNCVYEDTKEEHTIFNSAPIVLITSGKHICFFDRHITVNGQLYEYDDMPAIMMMKASIDTSLDMPKDVKK